MESKSIGVAATILLASEDEALVRRLGEIFASAGFALEVVDTVGDVDARVSREAESYFAMIVDVRLRDGADLMRLLEGPIPIIVVGTTHVSAEMRSYVKRHGGVVIDEDVVLS